MSGSINLGNCFSSPRSSSIILTNELEKLLCIIAGIFCASVHQSNNVPPGCCDRIRDGLNSPTIGSLFQLILWFSGQLKDPSVASLSDYFAKRESHPNGWFNTAVQMRNKWQHSKAETPEQVLGQFNDHLNSLPPIETFGHFSRNDQENTIWVGNDRMLILDPFVTIENEVITYLSALRENNEAQLSVKNESRANQIKEILRKMRKDDNALLIPTKEDFWDKIHDHEQKFEGTKPWWLKNIIKSSAVGRLTDSMAARGVAAYVKEIPDCEGLVYLEIKENMTIAAAISRYLGFANPISLDELLSFGDKKRRVLFIADLNKIETKEFINALLWLWDIAENGGKDYFKFLFIRSPQILEKEDNQVYERISGGLDSILTIPPRVKQVNLPDLIWSEETQRLIFSLS